MRYLIIIIFNLLSTLGFTQDFERSIKISKEVGRTIDSLECRKYELDFCSEDFVSAQVISISGSTMILGITKKDTITESYFSEKELTKLRIAVGHKNYTNEHLESMRSPESVQKKVKVAKIVVTGLLIISIPAIYIISLITYNGWG